MSSPSPAKTSSTSSANNLTGGIERGVVLDVQRRQTRIGNGVSEGRDTPAAGAENLSVLSARAEQTDAGLIDPVLHAFDPSVPLLISLIS